MNHPKVKTHINITHGEGFEDHYLSEYNRKPVMPLIGVVILIS